MPQHDPNLYLEYVVIQVEDVLFKVPTSIFGDSEVFHGMFSLPQQGADNANSDVNPLILPDMKASEFRVFTQAALAHMVNATAKLNVREWCTVLELSHKWGLDTLYSRAIEQCGPLFDDSTSATQLSLAYRFEIEEWKYPAIQRLVCRELPLSRLDIDLLGSATTAKLWQVREANMRESLPQSRRGGRRPMYHPTTALIRTEFGCERKVSLEYDLDD